MTSQNDSSDLSYYPIISAFSDLDLSASWSKAVDNQSIISFPILSLAVNALFFKIIGSYSFILLEIICSAFFIFIFYNIFLKLIFPIFFSIISSIFLFILPTILTDLAFINIKFASYS